VAWDPDLAAKRTLRAITENKVKTVDGNDIPMRADCICVHSDTPGAVAVAQAVRQAISKYLN
jgi:5-oxoprolinase (ATP-hydrolysing) subunit A